MARRLVRGMRADQYFFEGVDGKAKLADGLSKLAHLPRWRRRIIMPETHAMLSSLHVQAQLGVVESFQWLLAATSCDPLVPPYRC
jgi:hypothetical protein